MRPDFCASGRRELRRSLVIAVDPSGDVHAEHAQGETGREYIQIVQSRSADPPRRDVDEREHDNAGNSVGCESRAHARSAMIDIDHDAIVTVKRLGGNSLRIVCPYCRTRKGRGKANFYWHGDGGEKRRLYLGHRVAHCCTQNLPPQLRPKSLGYHLIDLSRIKLSEDTMNDLFAEMDRVADTMPATPGFWDDAKIEFRYLQKLRSPDL